MNEERTLVAGPLQATYFCGELRHVRLGGFEIVQRIYAAIRDHKWGTIPARLENVSINAGRHDFRITFDSIHQQRDIDFRWRGTLTGTASGSISFVMDGKAHSTFLRNRIGLCVHHGLRECAGKPCVVETADGALERTAFPEFVSPHQPFLNVRAISYEVAPGTNAEVRFHGDIFETEDHRNWTDANFKTYGTPLHLPFPVQVTTGSEVRQRVEIKLDGDWSRPQQRRENLVRLRTGKRTGQKLPRIGLGMAGDGRNLSARELQSLRRLRLSHLRLDLSLASDPVAALNRAEAEGTAIGARVEAAVMLPGNARALQESAPYVDRWLIYQEGDSATGLDAARQFRAVVGPEAFLAVGTNANFAELNRNRPYGHVWDAAWFAVNPQVHAIDDESVMTNAAGQFDAVRSAQRFLGGRPVVVSPVTLRPRLQPDANGGTEPAEPDPRQKLPLCAAWTVASLKALAEAGVYSVTYFETSGAGGVLDGKVAYPVFRVFEAAGEFVGADVVTCECSDPSRVAALVLENEGRRRMLIANLTSSPCEIVVDSCSEPLCLEPYAVTRLDRAKD